MTITTIDHAAKTGAAIANQFIDDLDALAITDEYALYQIVDGLTHRQSGADDVKLRGLLFRIQKQLEAQR
jgi:hypothetical protein